MKPFIHSNGNSKQSLEKEAREAHDAIRAARNAVDAITVHRRNYYPLGEEGNRQFNEDLDKHRDMLLDLSRIEAEIRKYQIYLANSLDATRNL